jgi:hypothetical protein
MQDGSIILVEIARGTLTRVWKGRTEVIATGLVTEFLRVDRSIQC